MRESNIARLVEASPFSTQLPAEVFDWITDFFMESCYDIDNINVDDLIVNGITTIDIKDYDEYEADYTIIHEDEDTYWVY